jgi:hypothetical protein
MDVEPASDDAHQPGWSAAFVRDDIFDSSTEACFDHLFVRLFLCSVILIPGQLVELLSAFVHLRTDGLACQPLTPSLWICASEDDGMR